MAQHRYRQHKVKREHTIIEGLLPLLESIAELDGVQSVTPGRINPRSRNGEAGLFFQYKTETGVKLIGRSRTAVQEVFVVTDNPDGVIEALINSGLVKPGKLAPAGGPGMAGPSGKKKARRKRAQASPTADAQGAEEARTFNAEAPGGPQKAQPSLEAGADRSPKPGADRPDQARAFDRARSGNADQAKTIEKVEPKLWNEVLKLHQELLELEKALGDKR